MPPKGQQDLESWQLILPLATQHRGYRTGCPPWRHPGFALSCFHFAPGSLVARPLCGYSTSWPLRGEAIRSRETAAVIGCQQSKVNSFTEGKEMKTSTKDQEDPIAFT
jgi:hypothetical protein